MSQFTWGNYVERCMLGPKKFKAQMEERSRDDEIKVLVNRVLLYYLKTAVQQNEVMSNIYCQLAGQEDVKVAHNEIKHIIKMMSKD